FFLVLGGFGAYTFLPACPFDDLASHHCPPANRDECSFAKFAVNLFWWAKSKRETQVSCLAWCYSDDGQFRDLRYRQGSCCRIVLRHRFLEDCSNLFHLAFPPILVLAP